MLLKKKKNLYFFPRVAAQPLGVGMCSVLLHPEQTAGPSSCIDVNVEGDFLLSKENISCRVSSLCLPTASGATRLSHITEAAVATTEALWSLCMHRECGCVRREKHRHALAPCPCALPAGSEGPQAARQRERRGSLFSVPEMLLCASVPLAASLGSPFLTCPAPREVAPGPAASLQAKLRQLQGSRQRTMHFPSLCPVMVWGNTAPLGAWPPRAPAVSLGV